MQYSLSHSDASLGGGGGGGFRKVQVRKEKRVWGVEKREVIDCHNGTSINHLSGMVYLLLCTSKNLLAPASFGGWYQYARYFSYTDSNAAMKA